MRQDYDLTLSNRKMIRTEDTFATACLFLGIAADEDISGKPVIEVLTRSADFQTPSIIRGKALEH